jgi:hypothetical protein
LDAALSLDDPAFLSKVVDRAGATPRTREAAAALDTLDLLHTPTGRLAKVLDDFELIEFDEAAGECVGGPAYHRMRAADAAARKRTRKSGPAVEFYTHTVLLVALQKAFLAGRLKFGDMALTLYYCVFGRYFWASLFWAAGFTMRDAVRFQMPLDWIPMEVRVADFPHLPAWAAWVRELYPNSIVIKSAAVCLELCQATNLGFFDQGKCVLWVVARTAFFGGSHPLALAAVASVGAGPAELAAPRAAVPLVRFSSRDAALTAAAAPFVFQLRFAKPATKSGAPRWTPFHEVRDLVPAVKALKRYNDWDALKRNDPWVRQSDTVRVLEIGAQIVFAGLPIEFIAPPVSLAAVFDPTCECRKDLTYTIWAGVDFEVKMPDGRVFSKREFLKEVLKADMA